MKLCHVSDSHLGAGAGHPKRAPSGLTMRQEDIINSFIIAVDRIIESKPDVCIHSGDLFDAVRPINRIMAIAGEQLHRLAHQNGIPTIIITGNHDAPKQPHLGAALDVYRQIDNLHVASEGTLKLFKINRTTFAVLPHCLTNSALQKELQGCAPDPSAQFNVFVTHGVAAGMPEFSMAELGEQEIPLQIMNRFDYTALGHFHNHCQVAPRAWYAGSTERLSQSERDVPKGFIEVDLDPFEVTFHEVPCRQMVTIPTVNAAGKRGDQLAEILRQQVLSVDAADKIVRVKVEGVTEETLKTIPATVIDDIRQHSFDVRINFEKTPSNDSDVGFGRAAIGRIDVGFLEFLETVDLTGFDRERLKRDALKYLNIED